MKKRVPKAISEYYAAMGRKSAAKRAKRILEKAKVEKNSKK